MKMDEENKNLNLHTAVYTAANAYGTGKKQPIWQGI